MKKILGCIGLCCLLLLPITASVSDHNKISNTNSISSLNQNVVLNDPPAWANGNFTGEWGITLFGIPLDPSGWISGYYENIGFGQLDAVYGNFSDSNASSFLKGFMLWAFFIGVAGNIETGNGTFVMGLGYANETHYFYYRISAIIGPSFYILAHYTPFEKESR